MLIRLWVLLVVQLVFFSFPSKTKAQNETEKKYTYTISGNYFRGFAIKHTPRISHLTQGHISGFELGFLINSYGHKPYEQVLKYPDIGLTVSHFDYNNQYMGKTYSAIIFSDFYLARNRYFDFFIKIGTGAGYNTNPYQRYENHKNIALGSRYSFALQSRFGLNIKIVEQLTWNNYFTITHFSSASIKQPNTGINLLTFNTGLSYRLNMKKPEYILEEKSFIFKKGLEHNLRIGFSKKEVVPIGNGKFPVYSISYYVNKRMSSSSSLNTGLDFIYNSSLKMEMKRFKVDPDNPPDIRRLGITVGHELAIGKMAMLTQLGIYFYRPFKANQPIYQRYGLKYNFHKHMFGQLSFLSHYAKADFPEFSLGFKF